MQDARLAPTANRSTVCIMNEITFMTETARAHRPDLDTTDLSGLARWLAGIPCSPLSKRHTTPGRVNFAPSSSRNGPPTPEHCTAEPAEPRIKHGE
jgi:hypothetical protein